jgi:large subunit ribosomal protein L9
VDAIKDARGLNIDRRKVHLDEPIRTVGTRMVDIEIGDGVIASIKTMVVEQK